MYIGIPQFIYIIYYIVWMLISLCIVYINDEDQDKHDFRVAFISVVILFAILYWGGFFG